MSIAQQATDFWFGLPDFVRRPIRTFAQAIAAFAAINISIAIVDVTSGGNAIDIGIGFVEGAALAGAAAVVSLVQNWIEEARGAQR